MQTVPLFSDRSYSYTVLLNGISWSMSFLWNPRNQQWNLTIAYDDTGDVIISGVPVLAGVNILSQFLRPRTEFGKLILWNDDWNTYIDSGTIPADGFQDMGFSGSEGSVVYPESGLWQPNVNPVEDYTLYYFLPDEDIPEKFSFTPAEADRDAIISKVVYGQWEP